jgi:uncharacterized membrane protein (UPF0127 family)
MMKNKKNLIGFLVVLIFLVFLLVFIKEPDLLEISKIQIGDVLLKVDVANTKTEQVQGLSGRNKLDEDTGMFFIFEKVGPHYFWMKDMNFPIDIIWLNEDFQIIFIEKNTIPDSYPQTFGPNLDSKYVLEVVSGFSEKNNLKVGEKLEFLP